MFKVILNTINCTRKYNINKKMLCSLWKWTTNIISCNVKRIFKNILKKVNNKKNYEKSLIKFWKIKMQIRDDYDDIRKICQKTKEWKIIKLVIRAGLKMKKKNNMYYFKLKYMQKLLLLIMQMNKKKSRVKRILYHRRM